MESSVLSSAASSASKKSPVRAAFRDAEQEFRYVLMRTVRLMLAFVFEGLTLVGTAVAGLSTIVSVFYILTLGWLPVGAKDWEGSRNVLMDHPLALMLVSIPLTFFFVSQWLAITSPYHFNTKMPGLNTKHCWHCGTEIQDVLRCTECKAFRLGRVLTKGLWVYSLAITVFYIVHDLIGSSLLFFRTPGMKA